MEHSDYDMKGVCILPDKRYFIGTKSFEQQDAGWDTDKVIFHLPKFINLVSTCNPNVIEILFGADEDVRVMTPLGKKLRDSRELFLSRQAAKRFTGYAKGELNKMEGHHRWMTKQPEKPEQKDFIHTKDFVQGPLGTTLPHGAKILSIRQATLKDLWDFNLPDEARKDGLGGWHIITAEVFDKSAYEAQKNEWEHATKWREKRNPTRAALEIAAGYDTKNGAHLVRLLRMGKEIVETGKVIVKRPDSQELLSIRNGAWSYDKIIDYAKSLDAEVKALYDKSPLPESPDLEAIETLQMELVEEHVWRR